ARGSSLPGRPSPGPGRFPSSRPASASRRTSPRRVLATRRRWMPSALASPAASRARRARRRLVAGPPRPLPLRLVRWILRRGGAPPWASSRRRSRLLHRRFAGPIGEQLLRLTGVDLVLARLAGRDRLLRRGNRVVLLAVLHLPAREQREVGVGLLDAEGPVEPAPALAERDLVLEAVARGVERGPPVVRLGLGHGGAACGERAIRDLDLDRHGDAQVLPVDHEVRLVRDPFHLVRDRTEVVEADPQPFAVGRRLRLHLNAQDVLA